MLRKIQLCLWNYPEEAKPISMVVIQCTQSGCSWKSADRSEAFATVLAAELSNHTAVSHNSSNDQQNSGSSKKIPSIERPKIANGSTEETWSVFLKKWQLFKSGTNMAASEFKQPPVSVLCRLTRGWPATWFYQYNECYGRRTTLCH